jgi:hypothetical protein
MAKVLPEFGEQFTVGLAGFVSSAVAVKVTAAPLAPVASTTMVSLGTVSEGAVVSGAVSMTKLAPVPQLSM